MGKALAQLWVGLTTSFVAFEILMRAVLHLCTWAEQTAGAFEDEARVEREVKLAAKKQELLGNTPTP